MKKKKAITIDWKKIVEASLEHYQKMVVEMPDVNSTYIIVHLYGGKPFVPKCLKTKFPKIYLAFRVHWMFPERDYNRRTNPKRVYPGYSFAAKRRCE